MRMLAGASQASFLTELAEHMDNDDLDAALDDNIIVGTASLNARPLSIVLQPCKFPKPMAALGRDLSASPGANARH
jgi:hypothetical protein